MQDGMQHLLEATELDPSLVAAQIDLADALRDPGVLWLSVP